MIVRESISFERYKDPKTALFGWRPGQLLADRDASDIVDYVVIFVAKSDNVSKVYTLGTLDKMKLYPKKFQFYRASFEQGFHYNYPSTSSLSDLTTEEKNIINNTLEKTHKNYIEIAERATNLKIFT